MVSYKSCTFPSSLTYNCLGNTAFIWTAPLTAFSSQYCLTCLLCIAFNGSGILVHLYYTTNFFLCTVQLFKSCHISASYISISTLMTAELFNKPRAIPAQISVSDRFLLCAVKEDDISYTTTSHEFWNMQDDRNQVVANLQLHAHFVNANYSTDIMTVGMTPTSIPERCNLLT